MQRRQLAFRNWDELIDDLERLQRSGYIRLGRWTLSQICDHLAIFLRGSLEGFSQRVPWIIRVLVGKPLLRSILRRGGFKEGVRVPKSFLPGDPREDLAAVEALTVLIHRFRTHEGPYQPSPIFGQLSGETWTRLHLIHAGHHLSFLLPAAGAETEPGVA